MTDYSRTRMNDHDINRLKARQRRQLATLHLLGSIVLCFGAFFFLFLLIPWQFEIQWIHNLIPQSTSTGGYSTYLQWRLFLVPLFLTGIVAAVSIQKYPSTFPELYQDHIIHTSIRQRDFMIQNLVTRYLFRFHNYVLGIFALSGFAFYLSLSTYPSQALQLCSARELLLICAYLSSALYMCFYLYFRSHYSIFHRDPPFPIHLFRYINRVLTHKQKAHRSIFVHNQFSSIDADKLFFLWTDYSIRQIASITTYPSEKLWQWLAVQWLTFTCHLYESHDNAELLRTYRRFWCELFKRCPVEVTTAFAIFITIHVDEQILWKAQEPISRKNRKILPTHIALIQCSLLQAVAEQKKIKLADIVDFSKALTMEDKDEIRRILRNTHRFLQCGCVYEVHTTIHSSKRKLSKKDLEKLIIGIERSRSLLKHMMQPSSIVSDLYSDRYVHTCFEILSNNDIYSYAARSIHQRYGSVKPEVWQSTEESLDIQFVENFLGLRIE